MFGRIIGSPLQVFRRVLAVIAGVIFTYKFQHYLKVVGMAAGASALVALPCALVAFLSIHVGLSLSARHLVDTLDLVMQWLRLAVEFTMCLLPFAFLRFYESTLRKQQRTTVSKAADTNSGLFPNVVRWSKDKKNAATQRMGRLRAATRLQAVAKFATPLALVPIPQSLRHLIIACTWLLIGFFSLNMLGPIGSLVFVLILSLGWLISKRGGQIAECAFALALAAFLGFSHSVYLRYAPPRTRVHFADSSAPLLGTVVANAAKGVVLIKTDQNVTFIPNSRVSSIEVMGFDAQEELRRIGSLFGALGTSQKQNLR
jgi:hypothetical protein